ncbi:hypothetical protein GYA25_03275 [Candidatus Woesearchaeota archaeon]|jgi:hypothetical protein|nr:hypothetical protein [Candidatus Woesearchaeota archaeon]
MINNKYYMEINENECQEILTYLKEARREYQIKGLDENIKNINKYIEKFSNLYAPISFEEMLERR